MLCVVVGLCVCLVCGCWFGLCLRFVVEGCACRMFVAVSVCCRCVLVCVVLLVLFAFEVCV